MQQPVLVAIIIIVLIFLVRILTKKPAGNAKLALTYAKNFSILNSSEKKLLNTLVPLLDKKYIIFAKARLADVIQIKQTQEYIQRPDIMARINATTVSFVLCNKEDFSIAGIIDMAKDNSDPENNTVMSDVFIDNAASAAGLPFVRIPLQQHYDPEELVSILEIDIGIMTQLANKENRKQHGFCPLCGESLLLLKAKHGENIGKNFLGCVNYPECKYLSLIEKQDPDHDPDHDYASEKINFDNFSESDDMFPD